jgi:hypothetical protein
MATKVLSISKMRTRNKFILPIFSSMLLLLLLLSCKKDEVKQLEKRLIGEWAWVRSTGGLMGTSISPDTEGFSESYLFQKNGIFTRFRDTATLFSHFYWLEKGTSLFDTSTVNLLKLGNQDHTIIFATYSFQFNGENGLILREECNDCFEIILNRKD